MGSIFASDKKCVSYVDVILTSLEIGLCIHVSISSIFVVLISLLALLSLFVFYKNNNENLRYGANYILLLFVFVVAVLLIVFNLLIFQKLRWISLICSIVIIMINVYFTIRRFILLGN